MKEVTRIRIAKSTYDIEIDAKKQLERYITTLTAYVEDENFIEDIEIRITELLQDRAINANGVIGVEDVAAIKEILGEPQDFSGEGDVAIGEDSTLTETEGRRKWYRDVDHAVFGGVLSGLARYFAVNPIVVRLLFIVVFFISAGLITLVYIVLWVLLPAAITVTEKLQARGEAVTLAAIRQQTEGGVSAAATEKNIQIRRKLFGYIVASAGIVGAFLAMLALGTSVYALVVYADRVQGTVPDSAEVLFIASGVLLFILMSLITVAGFKAHASKRMLLIMGIIIVLGISTFSTAIAMVSYKSWQRQNEITSSIKERPIVLPNGFDNAQSLIVAADFDGSVEYRVSQERRATITSTPGQEATFTMDGTTAKVVIKANNAATYSSPFVTIYGPELSAITVNKGTVNYNSASTQQLEVTAEGGRTGLYGSYGKVTGTVGETSGLDASGAAVKEASVSVAANGRVLLGNIGTLTVQQPTTCASTGLVAEVFVRSIGDRDVTYNGVQRPVGTIDETCGSVRVGTYSDNDLMQYN